MNLFSQKCRHFATISVFFRKTCKMNIQSIFVLACSRDGSARLWNCGDGKCIRILAERDSVINSCALGTNEQCGISQSQTQGI